jgi:NAD(P)-dependent dehydrogenase (short-subunit alcohol dehydrogenase family)
VTDTPILDSQSEEQGRDEVVKMYLNMIPIGRLAEAVEIANAAVFLGSEQSSYMTGADLIADGGVGQV